MKQFYKYILLAVAALSCLGSITAQTYNGGTWYSLYETSSYNRSTAAGGTIHTYDVFPPTSGMVTMDTYMTVYQVLSTKGTMPGSYNIDFDNATISVSKSEAVGAVKESVSGRIIKSYSYSYKWITNKSASGVSQNITSLSANYDYDISNTLRTVYIRNVKVPLKKHILLQSGTYGTTSNTHSFGESVWEPASPASYTVKLRSFLTAGNITVKIKGTDADAFSFNSTNPSVLTRSTSDAGKSFSVGSNACASANGTNDACAEGKLGKIDNYKFTVYFNPQKKHVGKSCEAYIEITDGTSIATMTLKGTCVKRNQTIQDFPTGTQTVETSFTADYNAYTTDNLTSAPNNLPVTYSSNNTSVATVDANTGVLTILRDGTVTIKASQAGNEYYNAATSKSVTYHIIKRNQTIQDFPTGSQTVETSFTADYNAYTTDNQTGNRNNLTVTYSSSDTSVATVDTNTGVLTIKKDGTVTITASQAGDFIYYPTSKSVTYTITKRNQTIQDFPTGNVAINTIDVIDFDAYTTDNQTGNRNNLTVTYSSSKTSIATVSADGKLTILAEGTVTITASQAGDFIYYPTSKSVTYTITKRNQTIQDFPTGSQTIRTTDVIDFDAYTTDNTTSAANNLTVTYSSNNTAVATVNADGKLTIIKDGTVTVTTRQAGNFYYYPTELSVTYTINKVTPTLTAPDVPESYVYTPGEKVEDHWTGGSAVDDKGNSVAGTFSCADELRNHPAGEDYTVTFTPQNTNWYNSNTITIHPTITRAAQEIVWTMEDGTECLTGTALGAYATSGLHVEYSSSDETVATVDNLTGELVVSKINSEVEVTVCQAGDLNYEPAECVSKTLMTVGARPDNFASVTASDITYEQTLSASVISGEARLGEQVVAGTFSWVRPGTLPDAGDAQYEARFSPTDADVYSPATLLVSVHVNKAQPVITANISNPLMESTTYYNAFSSNNKESALQVSITTGNDYASYSDGKLVLSAAPGNNVPLSVTVSQAATSNYLAASQSFSFRVYQKSKVCVPIKPYTEELFASSKIYEGNSNDNLSSWCPSDEINKTDNYTANFNIFNIPGISLDVPTNINVRYSQYEGIQLGSYKDGLSGWNQLLRTVIYNRILTPINEVLNRWFHTTLPVEKVEESWSSKYVDLSFTGVPDSLYLDAKYQEIETRAHIEFDFFSKHINEEILPTDFPATIKRWKVYVYKGNDLVQIDSWEGDGKRAYALDSTVRRIRIQYEGNFAGYVRDLRITRKHYIGYAEPATLTFGTSSPLHPLQEPQRVNIRYSSIAASAYDYCDNQEGYIVVSSSKPDVFYADVDTIRQNTNFDLTGNYDVNIRCTDVNATGDIIFRSSDGLEYRLPVHSENIAITAANPATDLFRTGTEQSFAESTAYRGITDLDLSGCFDESGNPLYDTLYIFGVTGNVGNAEGYHDFSGGLQRLPVVNTPSASIGCNAHTPCFVYRRNGNAYSHSHTVQAASDRLGVLTDDNTKLYLTGYCPFANTGTADEGMGFVCFTGKTDVYLDNFEASSRNHTISGSSTPEPQDQTFYLGDNYLSNGIGTLLAWTNSEANIHLKGQNSLRAAYGKQIGKATARSREIVIDMSDIENTQVPAAAITFLPQADNDAWNLSIDNVWIDDSKTGGELTLQGSDGAGSIDVGTPYATINIGKNSLGEDIVKMADVVDGIKKIGCRLFMAENKGQGVSVYGIGDFYEPKASAWAAALPGRSGDAAVQALDEQNHVLYASLDPVNVADGLSVAGEIDNSSSYKAAKRQTLLLNAPADTWQTFVAPFDITDVFILEAIDESTLSGKTISEGKLIQAEANKELLSYLASEIPAAQDQPKADKSTVILISNWLAQKRDAARAEGGDEWTGNKAQYNTRGLYEIEHYDPNFYGKGKSNIWTSSWYLYEVEGGADSWTLNDDGTSFNSEWQAVHRGDDGILMHKGKTYAWQLPYCVACPGNTQWDYWSGKILVFEGYGEQDIDGALDAEDLMSEALTEAVSNSAEGYFAGNTALRPIALPADAFVHDTDPASPTYDYFVKKSEGTEVGALSAALFTKITPPKGMHLSAVARSGKIVYGTDETELTTDLEALYGGHTASTADNGLQVAMTASGIMVTITDDCSADSKNLTLAVFSADGKRVYSEPVAVGTSVELNLTQGVYMLSTSDGRTAKVLIR